MTEQEDRKEFVSLSPLPILARLDRLEHMLQIFQEKNRSLPVWTSPSAIEMEGGGGEQYCKTLSSALQEVQLKGNIIERLQSLENRVAEIKTLKESRHTEGCLKNSEDGQKSKRAYRRKWFGWIPIIKTSTRHQS